MIGIHCGTELLENSAVFLDISAIFPVYLFCNYFNYMNMLFKKYFESNTVYLLQFHEIPCWISFITM